MAFTEMQASLSVKAVDGSALTDAMQNDSLGSRIKAVRKRLRLSQEKFAEAIGKQSGEKITRGAVGNWELGGGVERKNLRAIADLGGVTLDELEGRALDTNLREPATTRDDNRSPIGHKKIVNRSGEPFAGNARISGPVSGFGRIPVRGQGMGGKEGTLVFPAGDQNMGDVLAPPVLANVDGAYAAYVVGDSMLDRYRHGELVYVHPYLPVRKGDDVIVQYQGDDGERYGLIKRFISRDATWLKLEQLKPKKVIKLPVKKVLAVHTIVMAGRG